MAITVLIPTMLRGLTAQEDTVSVEAATVGELVDALETHYPGMGARLRSQSGSLNKFINFYVNNEDIRFLDNEKTQLKDGDEFNIVPAVAGGIR